jgi:hypothetical protein
MLSAPWPVGDDDLVTWYLGGSGGGGGRTDSVMGIDEEKTRGNPHNPPRG